jgi:hypothetical protein
MAALAFTIHILAPVAALHQAPMSRRFAVGTVAASAASGVLPAIFRLPAASARFSQQALDAASSAGINVNAPIRQIPSEADTGQDSAQAVAVPPEPVEMVAASLKEVPRQGLSLV